MASALRKSSLRAVRRHLVRSRAHFRNISSKTQTVDKLLFTPGPLGVSMSTKEAMLRDLGSRDQEFINVVQNVRSELLRVAEVDPTEYAAIPMQGSGTFVVESVLTSVVPEAPKGVLIVANGAYGERQAAIAQASGIRYTLLSYSDDEQPSLADIEAALDEDSGLEFVSCVHSETTSGIVNDITAIGQIAKTRGRGFIVDAMSSFGGYPIDFAESSIDFLVSSANKCLQGVPGFGFAIARREALAATQGRARSLSLNLHDQDKGLDANGQFRFTPPTHSLLAFNQALKELKEEGGVSARMRRYATNKQVVWDGLRGLGFEPYLDATQQGHIISSFKYPKSENWNFNEFYTRLNDRGFVIYPGKVTKAEGFRIGHIGDLTPNDSAALVDAVREVCRDMRIF